MAKRRYKAVLFAPDGDWVTDFRGSESVEAVRERLADMGSRWYFYPFSAVIVDHGALTTDRQRLVDAAEPFEDTKGLSIRTVGRIIAETPRDVLRAILS